MNAADRAEIEALAQRVLAEQRAQTWQAPYRRRRSPRSAVDAAVGLLCWPLMTTAAALLPRKWGRWLRESPDDDVTA